MNARVPEPPTELDPIKGELYLAGQFVPAGVYRQLENRREIVLQYSDYLPASLDGQVACYECVRRVYYRKRG